MKLYAVNGLHTFTAYNKGNILKKGRGGIIMIRKKSAFKLSILSFCVLGIISFSSIPAKAERSAEINDVCVSSSLNVRSGPSTAYPTIATLARGVDLVGGDIQGQVWQGNYLWRNYYYPSPSIGSYKTGVNGWVVAYDEPVGPYVQNSSLGYKALTGLYKYYNESFSQVDYSQYYSSGSTILTGTYPGYQGAVYSPNNINAWKTNDNEWVDGWKVNVGPIN